MGERFRSVARGVAWRNLHNFFGNPGLVLPAVVFPLFFFAAFAGGLSRVGQAPGFDFPDYTAFQFVFVLLQSAAFGGVFTGFSMARDFESGFGRRMMMAAPHRVALLVGYGAAAMTRALFTMAVITGVALAVGMKVGGDGVDLVGLYGLALLVNTAAFMWAAGIALRFQSLQAGPLMQTPVFLTLFLSPVYVPLPLLKGWIHGVASLNPITAMLEAGRGFIAGDPTNVTLAFAAALALIGVFVTWALRGLRKAEAAA
jgi:ABC-type multidrug transport system permease subunit